MPTAARCLGSVFGREFLRGRREIGGSADGFVAVDDHGAVMHRRSVLENRFDQFAGHIGIERDARFGVIFHGLRDLERNERAGFRFGDMSATAVTS